MNDINFFRQKRLPHRSVSACLRLLNQVGAGLKTQSLRNFWTCSKRYDWLRFSPIFRIVNAGISHYTIMLRRRRRGGQSQGVTSSNSCSHARLIDSMPHVNDTDNKHAKMIQIHQWLHDYNIIIIIFTCHCIYLHIDYRPEIMTSEKN